MGSTNECDKVTVYVIFVNSLIQKSGFSYSLSTLDKSIKYQMLSQVQLHCWMALLFFAGAAPVQQSHSNERAGSDFSLSANVCLNKALGATTSRLK